MSILTVKKKLPKTNIEINQTFLVKSFAYLKKVELVSDATKRLREEYLHCFQMRKWISSKLPKLNPDQVKTLYGMVKEWTGEEVDFVKATGSS